MNNKIVTEMPIKAPDGMCIDMDAFSKGRIEFKTIEKQLPESFEELGEIKGYWINGKCIVKHIISRSTSLHVDVYPTKELAEAGLALTQLLQLRDVYNDGWEPDWNNYTQNKYTIIVYKCEIVTNTVSLNMRILYFKTEKLRDKFLNAPEIRKLIEIAKPLI